MKKVIKNGESFILPWGATVLYKVDGKEESCSTQHRMLVTPVTSGDLSVPTRRGKILMRFLSFGTLFAILGFFYWALQGLVVQDNTNLMDKCTEMGGNGLSITRNDQHERIWTCTKTTDIGVVATPDAE